MGYTTDPMNKSNLDRTTAEAMASSFVKATPQVKELVGQMGGIGSSVAASFDSSANRYTWRSDKFKGNYLTYDISNSNWQVGWDVGKATDVSGFEPFKVQSYQRDLIEQLQGGSMGAGVANTARQLQEFMLEEQRRREGRDDKTVQANKIYNDLKALIEGRRVTSKVLREFFKRLQNLATASV